VGYGQVGMGGGGWWGVGEGQVGMGACCPDRQRSSEGVGVEVEAVEWLRLLLPCCSLTQLMSAVQL